MNVDALHHLDIRINKIMNNHIILILKQIKQMIISFYSQKKKIFNDFIYDDIKKMKSRTVRENIMIKILGTKV